MLNLISPGQVLSGNTPFSYNTINDLTGAKLVSSNGDLNDFTLSANSAIGFGGYGRVVLGAIGSSSPFPAVTSGRVGASHGYTTGVISNNPGTITANSFELRFNANLGVTGASFDFASLNTAGTTWEYSVIQFLDSQGNPFSSLINTALTFTPGAASQYVAAGGGFTGQAGLGNYVAASTSTVIGVGSNSTQTGMNGTNNNIPNLSYIDVGLSTGTQIGGIRWTTYLEDVRGTGNSTTNLTSALDAFTITGTVTPVPGPSLPGLGVVVMFGYIRKLRKRLCKINSPSLQSPP